MNKTLIFNTNYLGNPTPRKYGYGEQDEDTPVERWWQWKKHYARYNKTLKCFHDGALVECDEEILLDEDIVWGTGERIGRIRQDNWAGLRYYFGRGLAWGLGHGFDILAYIENDVFTRPRHDERIAQFLSGHDVDSHDIINDVNISNGSTLIIMGRVAACKMVDYFMLAENIYADDPDQIFELQVDRIKGMNYRHILKGYRLEGEPIFNAPADCEFIAQVNKFSRAKDFIYG